MQTGHILGLKRLVMRSEGLFVNGEFHEQMDAYMGTGINVVSYRSSKAFCLSGLALDTLLKICQCFK